GTHLLQFVAFSDALRGWGRTLRRAVGRWYEGQEPGRLAFQLAKYFSRAGWTHRDVLRKIHAVPATEALGAVYHWAVRGEVITQAPALLEVIREIRAGAEKPRLLALIREHALPRELVPSEMLTDPDVNEAMLPTLGLTALLRNLGNLTRLGVLT